MTCEIKLTADMLQEASSWGERAMEAVNHCHPNEDEGRHGSLDSLSYAYGYRGYMAAMHLILRHPGQLPPPQTPPPSALPEY